MRGRKPDPSTVITQPCGHCGAPVTRYRSQETASRELFCGVACWRAWQAERRLTTCAHCSTPFLRSSAGSAQRFCSRDCVKAARLDVDRAAVFWSHVERGDGCWLWRGPVNNGYGRVRINGVTSYAHRLSYELANGPIPDGQDALHDCPDGDNPLCVRPDHLFLGDQRTNNADRDAKGRVRYGDGHASAKLTAEQVRAIRVTYAAGGVSQRGLARLYGVTHGVIRDAIHGKSWRRVE